MKHNLSIILFIIAAAATSSFATDERIKKLKEDRDKIAELKEELCKDHSASRSECFKHYLTTIQVQEAPELVLLSVAATDMYARDRFQWEEKEIPFRFWQIENWYAAVERVDASQFKKAADQQALIRAKQKLMGKAQKELKVLYEVLSTAKDKEIDEYKTKYRELLKDYQKYNDLKFNFPKS